MAPSRSSVGVPVSAAILKKIAPYAGSAALIFLLTQAVPGGGSPIVDNSSKRVATHTREVTAREKIVVKGGSLVETTTVTRDTLITKE